MMNSEQTTQKSPCRRNELFMKGENTVNEFLLDLKEKINDEECQHFLIQDEIDSMVKKLIRTVDAFKAELVTACNTFEQRCRPIIERTSPFPAAILNKSEELLTEKNRNAEKWDPLMLKIAKMNVARFDADMRHIVEGILEDREPSLQERENDNFVDLRLDRDRDTPQEVGNILSLYRQVFIYPETPKVMRKILPRSIKFLPCIFSAYKKYKWDNKDCSGGRDYERGGLIYRSPHATLRYNHITGLVATRKMVKNERRFDEDCANVMIWLIKERLLTEEDVKDMYLMNLLILNEPQPPEFDSKPNYFAERRFQVLANHFPNCLVGSPYRRPPLSYASDMICESSCDTFISVWKAGIHKFPNQKGFLFLFEKFRDETVTPFERFFEPTRHKHLCRKSEQALSKTVLEQQRKKRKEYDERINERRLNALETVLNDPALGHPPYDTTRALLVAATSNRISLDGVYFTLRREPDILKTLLRYGDNDDSVNTNSMKRKNTTEERKIKTAAGLRSTKKIK